MTRHRRVCRNNRDVNILCWLERYNCKLACVVILFHVQDKFNRAMVGTEDVGVDLGILKAFLQAF